jgi:hypothetical protein
MTSRDLLLGSAASLLCLAFAGCQAKTAVSADPPAVGPVASAAPVSPGAATSTAVGAATTTVVGTAMTMFGEPLNLATQKVALADLVKKPGAFADKTVQTEGTVTSVCQARGCWLEIGDDSGTAHVKLGSHKFFVPRSSNGKRAKVEATVLPAVDTGHCEEEAEEQTGKVAKVELVATGVELF